jgi:hypothetical protein
VLSAAGIADSAHLVSIDGTTRTLLPSACMKPLIATPWMPVRIAIKFTQIALSAVADADLPGVEKRPPHLAPYRLRLNAA